MAKTPATVATYEAFIATTRFSALDGLRAISVLAVIWHHTSGMPGPLISRQGAKGVDFFFAISGFLITTLLLREGNKNRPISLRRFYARRALRIFPLYYAVLAVYFLLILLIERGTPRGNEFFDNLPAFLTYTVNWFVDLGPSVSFYHAWSLSTEEQYYLLWPVLLVGALVLSRNRPWAPLLVLSLLVVLHVGFNVLTNPHELPWRIPASLSLPILLASAAAVGLNNSRWFTPMAYVLGRRYSAIAVFAALGLLLAMGAWTWSIQVVMVLAVVTVTISEQTALHPLLRWRPLGFVGVISYGVYLMHMLSANVVRQLLHQQFSIALFVGTTVLVVAVAHLSFRYFEAPLLKIKRRFEDPDEKPGAELSRGQP